MFKYIKASFLYNIFFTIIYYIYYSFNTFMIFYSFYSYCCSCWRCKRDFVFQMHTIQHHHKSWYLHTPESISSMTADAFHTSSSSSWPPFITNYSKTFKTQPEKTSLKNHLTNLHLSMSLLIFLSSHAKTINPRIHFFFFFFPHSRYCKSIHVCTNHIKAPTLAG